MAPPPRSRHRQPSTLTALPFPFLPFAGLQLPAMQHDQSPSDILALFQQLRGRSKVAQEAAADSLFDVAYAPGGATTILQSGADLSLLVARVLDGRSSAVQFHALCAVTKLAVPESGRAAVAAAGAIPAAVEVLSNTPSDDWVMLKYAAGLLRTLAYDTDERVPAMVEAGALGTLTDVLRRSSHDAVLEQVGCALCNATADGGPSTAAAAAACLAAGAHTELLRHLSSDSVSAEAKMTLTAAIRALCIHAAGKPAVVAAGGLEVLARCMADSSAEVQKEAAAACVNLASGSSQHSTTVASHPQALPALVAQLYSPDAEVRANASLAINNIVCNSPGSTSALVAGGVLPGLVHLLRESSDLEQLYSAARDVGLLAAREPDARDAAVAAGAVAALQPLTCSADAGVRAVAADALEELDDGQGGGSSEEAAPPAKRSKGSS